MDAFLANTQIHRYSLVFLFCLFGFWGNAQKACEEKAAIAYQEALNFLNQGREQEAKASCKQILAQCPDFAPAALTLSDLYLQSEKYSEADSLYRILVNKEGKAKNRAIQQLGKSLFRQQRYAEAEVFLSQAVQNAKDPQNKASLQLDLKRAIWAKSQPMDANRVRFENLGSEINTESEEALAALTADEQSLIFTRRVHNQEDLFEANWRENRWSAVHLLEGLNTEGNEGAHCVSADGNTLIFTACDRRDGLGRCDLYVSYRQGNVWTTPQNLGPAINSPSWDAQPSLSFDGNWLFFCSTREGGQGGSDIWVSQKIQGEWSQAQNLGTKINTPGDEKSPFIHADMQSLYFASNGREEGFGGLDLYRVRLENGNWNRVENLGFPINSSSDESGLTVNARGNLAFINSSRLKGLGKNDLYQFVLPDSLTPTPQCIVQIQWASADKPQQIELKSMHGNQTIQSLESKNSILYSVPVNADYAFYAWKSKAYFVSEHIFPAKTGYRVERWLKSQSTDSLQNFSLKNVYFYSSTDSLLPISKQELKALAAFLTATPGYAFSITGHTDNQGNSLSNQKLSVKRAERIKIELIRMGIKSERVRAVYGKGDSQPVADNQSEEGRQKNRRAEITLFPRD